VRSHSSSSPGVVRRHRSGRPHRCRPCCKKTPAATIGIMLRVALLMIVADFDLSAGVAVTFSSLAASMLAITCPSIMWVGAGDLAIDPRLEFRVPQRLLVMKKRCPASSYTLSSFFRLPHQSRVTSLFRAMRHAERQRQYMAGTRLQRVFASSFRSCRHRYPQHRGVVPGGSPRSRLTCCSRPDRHWIFAVGATRTALSPRLPLTQSRWVVHARRSALGLSACTVCSPSTRPVRAGHRNDFF